MKRIIIFPIGILSLFLLCPVRTGAFSLLGPFSSWMTSTNGFGPPGATIAAPNGDIGGPMDIGDGYRWDVPVITYGFDKSFRDYFGRNGIAAVEDAIQILNDLPPASDIVLTNYPTQVQRLNRIAQAQNLYDLKSMALALLLEQLGLAQPTRFIYVLQRFDPTVMYPTSPYLVSLFWGQNSAISNQIVLRNFEPETLQPGASVNEELYTGFLDISLWPDQTVRYAIPLSIPTNPFINNFAVADWIWTPSAGRFFGGLTRDDVGGLRYLLSRDNINYESLLPSVHPIGHGLYGRERHGFVGGAWRPGIDKITVIPQPVNPGNGRFLPTSYLFKDIYLENGAVKWQELKRRVIRPDILFCAADTGEDKSYTPLFVCTGTTNWLNNAALNGITNGEGPGVIHGPIHITFHKLGPTVETGDFGTHMDNQSWASFDDSTNVPVVYPSTANSIRAGFSVRLRFYDTDFSPAVQITNVTWHLQIPIGGEASLQISSNQTDWTPLATVTNLGSVTEWYYEGSDNPAMSFRAVPR